MALHIKKAANPCFKTIITYINAVYIQYLLSHDVQTHSLVYYFTTPPYIIDTQKFV